MTDNHNDLHLPKYSELPSIELYLDQVLRVVNDAVRPYIFSEKDAPLTGTMVNNYVKHGVLPAPQKKLYQKEHLAKLIVITIMKSVYSIPEITRFFEISAQADLAKLYDLFCNEVNTVYKSIFSGQVPEGSAEPTIAFLRIMAASAMGKLYVQKMLGEPAESKKK